MLRHLVYVFVMALGGWAEAAGETSQTPQPHLLRLDVTATNAQTCTSEKWGARTGVAKVFRNSLAQTAAAWLPPVDGQPFVKNVTIKCDEPLQAGPAKRLRLIMSTQPMTEAQAKQGLKIMRLDATQAFLTLARRRLQRQNQKQWAPLRVLYKKRLLGAECALDFSAGRFYRCAAEGNWLPLVQSKCQQGLNCNTDCVCAGPNNQTVCIWNGRCGNGIKDGNETDIDCGGLGNPSKCNAGQNCTDTADCDTNNCLNGKCKACESYRDCGAEGCRQCKADGKCGAPFPQYTPCLSDPDKYCTGPTQQCVSCLSDLDCGGPGNKPYCDPDQGKCVECHTDTNCASRFGEVFSCDVSNGTHTHTCQLRHCSQPGLANPRCGHGDSGRNCVCHPGEECINGNSCQPAAPLACLPTTFDLRWTTSTNFDLAVTDPGQCLIDKTQDAAATQPCLPTPGTFEGECTGSGGCRKEEVIINVPKEGRYQVDARKAGAGGLHAYQTLVVTQGGTERTFGSSEDTAQLNLTLAGCQRKPPGAFCSGNYECASGWCGGNVVLQCKDLLPVGTNCTNGFQCVYGYCAGGRCQPRPNGKGCSNNPQCASRYCAPDGICKACTVPGAACAGTPDTPVCQDSSGVCQECAADFDCAARFDSVFACNPTNFTCQLRYCTDAGIQSPICALGSFRNCVCRLGQQCDVGGTSCVPQQALGCSAFTAALSWSAFRNLDLALRDPRGCPLDSASPRCTPDIGTFSGDCSGFICQAESATVTAPRNGTYNLTATINSGQTHDFYTLTVTPSGAPLRVLGSSDAPLATLGLLLEGCPPPPGPSPSPLPSPSPNDTNTSGTAAGVRGSGPARAQVF